MRVQGLSVFHLTARLDRPDIDLCRFDVGSWLWPRLREAFPLALSACLMPNHPHLLTPFSSAAAAVTRLNRLLGQLARRLGIRHLGSAACSTVDSRSKLLRDARYIALNPARGGLSADPMSGLFSTHRDVLGAAYEPWIQADRLASACGRRRAGFVAWYHRYVSADPSVDPRGTPLPRPEPSRALAIHPLATIARAAAAAHRVRPGAIQAKTRVREHFVALALEQGWRDLDQLAAVCRCTTRAVRYMTARVDADSLHAARLCLGDPRLLGDRRPFESRATEPRLDGRSGAVQGRRARSR